MKTLLSFFALLLMLSISVTPSVASSSETAKEITVIAVKMDAEWCGKCRVMNPKLESIMPTFKDESVLFVKLNMTDEFTTQQAGFLADRLQLTSLFNEHKGRTGYMVLVNAKTGEVLKTLQSTLSEDELVAEIKAVL
jgi:thiol-disulfide isomerase/thioredoxin